MDQQIESQSNNSKNIIAIFFSIIITALVVGITVFYWQSLTIKKSQSNSQKQILKHNNQLSQSQKKQNELKNQISSLQNQLTQLSISTTTKNQYIQEKNNSYKYVYTNEEFNYTFEYPQNWSFSEYGLYSEKFNLVRLFNPNDMYYGGSTVPIKISFRRKKNNNIKENIKNPSLLLEETMLIANETAYIVKELGSKSLDSSPLYSYVDYRIFFHDEYVFKIGVDSNIIADAISNTDKNVQEKKELGNVLNKVISTFKFFDKKKHIETSNNIETTQTDSQTILHPECNVGNPPRTYSYEKMRDGLNLCGNRIDLPAREFEDKEFALFVDYNSNDEGYLLKSISLKEPYNEIILGKISSYEGIIFDIMHNYEMGEFKDNYFVAGHSGCAPGSCNDIFILNYETSEFILFTKNISNCQLDMSLSGTKSEKFFNASYISENSTGHLKCLSLKDEEIKLTVNGENFTKKEINENKGAEYLDIINCEPLPLGVLSYEKEKLEEYSKYFPKKIPCYYNHYSDDRQLTGYINFENNKFIPKE